MFQLFATKKAARELMHAGRVGVASIGVDDGRGRADDEDRQHHRLPRTRRSPS